MSTRIERVAGRGFRLTALDLMSRSGVYIMIVLLLILCVLYLPGGLASLRWSTLTGWWQGLRLGLRTVGRKERTHV